MAQVQAKGRQRLHDLEMKHKSIQHQSELIAKDEEARRVRTRLMTIRDDNETLREAADQKDVTIQDTIDRLDHVQSELESSQSLCSTQEKKIKAQAREIANLQAEVQALGGISNDSAKILTEKLALSRELDNLRPEAEHLRSQLSHLQSTVAEKLALERQVTTLEVELEAEKRSKSRALSKEVPKSEDLQRRLDEAGKQLAAEKKAREREQKDSERELSEANAKSEMQEERIEALKAKLRSTQSDLKSCRADLDGMRQRGSGASVSSTTEKPVVKRASRKRQAADISIDDVTLETPGRADGKHKRVSKKKSFEPTLVGEKSTFSVTPFLNKTRQLGDIEEAPEQESDIGSPSDGKSTDNSSFSERTAQAPAVVEGPVVVEPPVDKPASPPQKKVSGKPAVKVARPRGRPRSKPLADISSSKTNKPIAASPTLAKVPEEDDSLGQENEVNVLALTKNIKEDVGFLGRSSSGSTEPEPKKKKRKLLGAGTKTLFDDPEDENNEAAKKPKVPLAPTRRLGKANLAAGSSAFSKTTFSPLKRDKRGIGASFLA